MSELMQESSTTGNLQRAFKLESLDQDNQQQKQQNINRRSKFSKVGFFLTLLIFTLIISSLFTTVDAKRKKKRRSNQPANTACSAAGLDCSDTCCITSSVTCAPAFTAEFCSGYYKRPFIELYVGLGIVMGLIFGIPIIVKILNCMVLTKFCQTYDENAELYWGGYSVCDFFTFFCPCFCYKRQKYEAENRRKAAEAKAKLEAEKQAVSDELEYQRKKKEDRKKAEEREVEVATKKSLIQSNKCLSCCCFVFGCIGNQAVEAEPKVPPVYFDDEDESPKPHPQEEEERRGGVLDELEGKTYLDQGESIGFGDSFKRDNNATTDKLNGSIGKKYDPEEDWSV